MEIFRRKHFSLYSFLGFYLKLNIIIIPGHKKIKNHVKLQMKTGHFLPILLVLFTYVASATCPSVTKADRKHHMTSRFHYLQIFYMVLHSQEIYFAISSHFYTLNQYLYWHIIGTHSTNYWQIRS